MELPTLISHFSDEIIASPTFNLEGAMIYLLSPSLYKSNAIWADLFGSYSILSTTAGISNLFLLKSITL